MHPPAMVRCCPDRLPAGLRVVGPGARSGPAPGTRRWRSCSPTPGARSCATPQRTRMASRRRLRTPPAPRAAVAKALLGAALLAPAEGDEHQHPGLAWKLEGEAVLLRITEAGLQAIGAARTVASPEAQAGSGAEPTGQAAAAAQEGAQAAVEPRGGGAGGIRGAVGGRPETAPRFGTSRPVPWRSTSTCG
jgi:hypothetical protein